MSCPSAQRSAWRSNTLHVREGLSLIHILNILVSLLPVLLMVGLFFLFFSKMNAGGNNKAFDFAKSRAKIQSNVKVRFKDVAGCDEEKEDSLLYTS